jgi:hypothetical protein
MVVHDLNAIKRNIHFVQDLSLKSYIHASERCCWNCHWSNMTYECLWCEREMDMVDLRDLCMAWKDKARLGNA